MGVRLDGIPERGIFLEKRHRVGKWQVLSGDQETGEVSKRVGDEAGKAGCTKAGS